MMNLISLFVVISAVSLFVVISGVWCYPEFQCPSLPHWNLRAGVVCNHTTDYRCLWDRNNEYHIEQCGGREYQKEGYRRIFSGGLDSTKCSSDRYQPFRYTTEGNFDCVFKKSTCTDLGQVVYDNGDRTSDRRCSCDYYNGYVFMIAPKHHCYCEPDREDCSCVFKTCPDDHIIDPDHECRHIRNWLISFRCKKLAEPDRNPVTLSPIDLDQDKSKGPRTSESSSIAALVVLVIIGIVILIEILTGLRLFLRVYMKEREEERKQNKQKIQKISILVEEILVKEDSVPKHMKELLITNGVNTGDVLFDACLHGHIDTVKMMLDRKADPSQCIGRLGRTPLYVACEEGHTEIVKLLLDRNVDVTQRVRRWPWSDVWETALDVARNNESIRNLIIQSYMK